MAFTTRVWGAGKLLVLAGALAATYFGFAAASMRLAIRAREVVVPDLTNKSADEATDAAGNLGLALRVEEVRRLDPKVEEGRVMAQEPAPGTVARRQRNVRVGLRAGAHAAMAPQLVGDGDRAAQLRAAQDGITVSVTEIRSDAFAPDVVVAQTPPARTPTSRVALLVNRSGTGASYVMPDLIGLNGDRAAEVLRGRGFRIAVVASNPYPGIAAGIVLRQSPQSGFRIAPGEPISLEVSR
jgi:serine/threonine-protein kinase